MVTAGAWGVLIRCTLPTSPCLVLLQLGLGALARLRACQSVQQPLAAAYSLWLCYSLPAPRPEFLLTLKWSSTYSWVGLATSSVQVCLAVALHSCACVCGKCLGCLAAPGYGGVCMHWQHTGRIPNEPSPCAPCAACPVSNCDATGRIPNEPSPCIPCAACPVSSCDATVRIPNEFIPCMYILSTEVVLMAGVVCYCSFSLCTYVQNVLYTACWSTWQHGSGH